MKLTRTNTWTRTKIAIAIATAITVPLVVAGGMAAANAGSSDPNPDVSKGTATLTEEGKKLAEEKGLPSSGSISVGGSADATDGSGPGQATLGKDGVTFSPGNTDAPMGETTKDGTFSGSAALTPEGLKLIEEKGLPHSGSATAGPDGLQTD